MFRQHSNPASDASQPRQVLTPLSGSSVNGDNASSYAGRKRKRDESTMESLMGESFMVKVRELIYILNVMVN